jgi:serine/threonine protein kinase
LRAAAFRRIVAAMPISPESIVGALVRGVFAPPTGAARAAQTNVAYKLLRFVGAGKFAWVFEAERVEAPPGAPPERVAIKMLYREDTQGIRRFQREIKVMRQLPAHPNCVAYKGHGTYERHAWVAMDFIDGFTLAAVLRGKKALPERAACLLMTQLCDGFEGLHRLGLTHRDITPENIMITQADRQVKLMDFGLVQDSQGLLQLYEQVDIVDGEDFKDDLDAGLIAGTPEFMAPEQILDPHEKDRARQKTDTTADVFALGTIFYQLLSGTQLFPYEVGAKGQPGKQGLINYLEFRVKHRDEDLACPDNIGDALWTIVKKSLAHEPKHRQRDATELGADIRYYLETGEGVLEDDMSATISAPMDPARLKSLALQMSTGEFSSIAKAAAAVGIELPPLRAAPQKPRRDTPPVLIPPEANTGPAPTRVDSTTATIPNEPLSPFSPLAGGSPLAAVVPSGPDAPLSPKKPASGRALYGGPASEKPTRIEGDAPKSGTLAPPKRKGGRRSWLLAALGAGFVGLGVLVAVLLRG